MIIRAGSARPSLLQVIGYRMDHSQGSLDMEVSHARTNGLFCLSNHRQHGERPGKQRAHTLFPTSGMAVESGQ